jgi:hypothetical protein
MCVLGVRENLWPGPAGTKMPLILVVIVLVVIGGR